MRGWNGSGGGGEKIYCVERKGSEIGKEGEKERKYILGVAIQVGSRLVGRWLVSRK